MIKALFSFGFIAFIIGMAVWGVVSLKRSSITHRKIEKDLDLD